MSSKAERFPRNTLRPFLVEKVREPDYVGHIGVVGPHDVGKNTLCERFGRMSGLMGEVEKKTDREWILDLSTRPCLGKRGTMLLYLHIIPFRKGAEKRNYVEILRKLNGIIFMFDITEQSTLHETVGLVADVVFDFYGSNRPPSILVGNKMDARTPSPSCVLPEDGDAASIGIHANSYFECSARGNLSCDLVLDYVLRMIIEDWKRQEYGFRFHFANSS
ncbi:hypothetical protein TNCT_722871 [Trichonephila clavata]|uniref:GTP-binding protein n=1 Tax=Trichonephila clavata TaxID=2740835 RepID=A0A8X6J657_TRICU|nr:hypothetical protein TNCT_722871 [Trichonephila clavata]